MKSIIIKILTLSICFALYNGCKKDKEEDPEPTPTTPGNTVPDTGIVCDGKAGDTSYFPLTLNNKWVFDPITGTAGTDRDTMKYIYYSGTVNGVNYNKFPIYSSVSHSTQTYYFRVDAQGNVYTPFTTTAEPLYMPVNPTVGQNLDFDIFTGYDRTVTSVTGTITTGKCNYTNLLVIELKQSGNSKGFVYYKKGLGIVYDTFNNRQLKEVILN